MRPVMKPWRNCIAVTPKLRSHTGPHADDLAGDEYYHHPARQIIGHWLQGKGGEPDSRLFWAAGDVPFREQVKRFEERLESGIRKWEAWLKRCDEVLAMLGPDDMRRAIDHLLVSTVRSICPGAKDSTGCAVPTASSVNNVTRKLSSTPRNPCGAIR